MQGVFSIANLASEAKQVVFVGFVEAHSFVAPQGRLRELGDNFHHIFSEEKEIGFLAASHQSRTCFISHNNCIGKKCFCQEFAAMFLCPQEEQAAVEMKDLTGLFLSQPSHTPLLAILVDDGPLKLVTHYSKYDLDVAEIPSGSYSIQNCLISECDPDSMKIVQEFATTNPLLAAEEEVQEASMKATVDIRDRIEYWPKPVGLGITLWKDSYQTVITVTNPIGNEQNDLMPQVAKPKKAVTGYNFFLKMSRKPAVDSNAVMGQKWRKMSRYEQSPYLEHAEEDKKRYEEEMKEYRAQTGDTNPSKSITAYDHFVKQEKQFIIGFGFKDVKTRIGKHCGDRWKNMDKEEKNLYHALKDVHDSAAKATNE